MKTEKRIRLKKYSDLKKCQTNKIMKIKIWKYKKCQYYAKSQ